MDRRSFLLTLAAASTWRGKASAQDVARLAIGPAPEPQAAAIPGDFTGLSYQSAQLANPDFFSVRNKQLIELFKGLSPGGNLRLGGGSSEFTAYSDASPIGPPPFEVFGPDTSKTVKHGTITTALALNNLRQFLDATNWSCLYGLNLGQGTKENAAAEAAAVQRLLGPRLLAFQIGNEPDSFRNRYRPATYGPADYMRQWNEFHDAIVARVPQAKFAGPDISNKIPYLTAFAAEAPQHKDMILLTGHYYAMGPARSPDATLEQLFEPDPKLATLHLHSLPEVEAAIETAGLPFRISEGNSCWDGGKPGVSDTLASALWCADRMLRFAQWGWAGVNLHGGGDGFYTPIAGSPSAGFTRRPEYFGIQFAQKLVGARFLSATLTGARPHVTPYALQRSGKTLLVIINKEDAFCALQLPFRPLGHAEQLTGPAFDARDGTILDTVTVPRNGMTVVPPHTAMIFSN